MIIISPVLALRIKLISLTAIAAILFSTNVAVAQPTRTFQGTGDDGFRVQIPEGWIIQDIDNTGSALLEESTQGYGLLAQLCPEEQQEAALPNVIGGSTTSSGSSISTSNSCVGAQDVIHIIRYPDLETRLGLTSGDIATNEDMTTTDNILTYHLQKLQEVGYRSMQIVNSTDVTVGLTNPLTNETLTTIPAKFVEMTYSAASAPDEIRRGYFIITAANITPPNFGTTKGYSAFYEGSSDTEAETTTASGSLPPLLPPAVGQIFGSFELIAAPEVAQTIPQEEVQTTESTEGVEDGEDVADGEGGVSESGDDEGGEGGGGSTSTSSSTSSSSPSSSGSSRCPDGYHRSPSGDCERVTDTRGMPRCPNGYHRSPDGDCEYVG